MRLLIAFLILTLTTTAVLAQEVFLRGKVTKPNGAPVPFASVYESNSKVGTSANSEGEYELKLDKTKHILVFKAIGFSQEIRELDLKSDQTLHVILQEAVYELKDVVVRAYSEDPAYEVIKNAIRKRTEYLNETDAFTTDVYIKGLQKLLGAPKKFLGRNIDNLAAQAGLDSNRTGILYLSESESKLSYMKPGRFREEMISSKVSGSNRAFSFNRASDIQINLYENLLNMEGLASRPFVSPIADNALFYYRYRLLGTSLENGELINKIELIPKRAADPVFRGVIYILEDSWRIHSADLYLTKEANINFVDTLNIRQEFIPLNSKVWMPSSVRYDFTGGFLGFNFGGYYIALFKNYVINPNLSQKDFKEVLKISREVNKKDTTYWNQARPIPLTDEEQVDYAKKEVLAIKRESKVYLDSLDKVNNKFKPIRFVIGSGYSFRNRFNKEYFQFGSMVNSLFYNTVEGFGLNYKVSYAKQIDSLTNKYVRYSGKLRYGLSSEKFYPSFSITMPIKNARVLFNAGSDVLNLSDQESMSQLGNSVNSLFYELNLLKLYESKFVNLTYSRPLGSVQTSFMLEFANRKSLLNTSDYTIRDLGRREFTSNNPFSPGSDLPLFSENQSLKFKLRASYAFNNTYSSYPTGKFYTASKYPRLGINYEKGVQGVLGSDTNYDQLSVDLAKSNLKMGLLGNSSFMIGAGKFLNNRSIYYTDYKLLMGTKTLSYTPRPNSFLYLDYYNYSTAEQYFEGHIEHNFSGFLINKVPLLRKLKLKELIGFNYLSTPLLSNYSEIYVGFEFFSLRAMYGWSYHDGRRMDAGFRISTGL